MFLHHLNKHIYYEKYNNLTLIQSNIEKILLHELLCVYILVNTY